MIANFDIYPSPDDDECALEIIAGLAGRVMLSARASARVWLESTYPAVQCKLPCRCTRELCTLLEHAELNEI